MTTFTEITDFLEFLGDAVLLTNNASEIIFANSACANLFDYQKSHITKLRLDDLLHNPQQLKHAEMVDKFISSQMPPKAMISRNIIPCVNSKGEELNARISIANVEIDNKPYGIATIEDYTPIHKKISDLELNSNVDPLTNLFNRHYLNEVLKPKSRVLLSWKEVGVMYLDLNKFKPVNDKYGHKAGDTILKTVANRLKESVRYDDIIFRIGGDEFLILLNLTDISHKYETLLNIGKKIRHKISEPILVERDYTNIGVSIGGGIYPDDDGDLSELIHSADKAMYLSKNSTSFIHFVSKLPNNAKFSAPMNHNSANSY